MPNRSTSNSIEGVWVYRESEDHPDSHLFHFHSHGKFTIYLDNDEHEGIFSTGTYTWINSNSIYIKMSGKIKGLGFLKGLVFYVLSLFDSMPKFTNGFNSNLQISEDFDRMHALIDPGEDKIAYILYRKHA